MLKKDERLQDLLSWACGEPNRINPSLELVDAACSEGLLGGDGGAIGTIEITALGLQELNRLKER